MQPTSELCRAQENAQLTRAADSTLQNVRQLAIKAAKAWGIEAEAAEKREARHAATLVASSDPNACAQFSENPDRGFAEPANIGAPLSPPPLETSRF